MNRHNFGPASPEDSIVHGACGPGDAIEEWTSFMQGQRVERVCCLQEELPELVRSYEAAFGKDNVKHAPIEDFHLCSPSTLKGTILPFLRDSCVENRRVVVHCAGGNGRTGHVLAAWLVFHAGMPPEEALAMVEQMGRDPREAIRVGNATEAELLSLLLECRDS